MVQSLQAGDFPLTGLLFHRVLQFELVVNFDRVLLLIPFVKAQSYLCVGALANAFANLVIVKAWHRMLMRWTTRMGIFRLSLVVEVYCGHSWSGACCRSSGVRWSTSVVREL
jgi:hypothetical protein